MTSNVTRSESSLRYNPKRRMMHIQVLPEEVASQIAAGEVVERPASVVKELLENALDAHSSAVVIRTEQAGRRLIEVADNGHGIPPEELELAVARHATSKLRSALDLFHISTLGFRGEALASVGSVSRLTISSREPEREIGARIVIEGGRISSIEKTGGPAGTVVRVEDLFYNVPARLKFLKQDITERQQINALVTRYSLAYPNVRMHLIQDGKTALQSNGNGDRRLVLSQLYGVEVARQMLEVRLAEDGAAVEGFISPVALTRSNRKEITFFVNGRWVQDASLVSALLKAYHTMLMVGRYPFSVIFIQLPPEEVDVNVHPAKAEVRFRNPDYIFSTVQRAIRRALLAHSPVPSVAPSAWQSSPAPGEQRRLDLSWGTIGNQDEETQEEESAVEAVRQETESETKVDPTRLENQIPLLRLVGQVGAAYLVAEGPDGLYLVDQHAAHERILFERLLRQRSTQIPSQRLLEPVAFQLPPHQSQLLENQVAVLQRLGFDIEPFGPNTYRIRAIPAILSSGDPIAAVRVVVEDFEEDETPLQSEIEARIAARVCKRVAVKAGQILSIDEQQALLHDLESCHSPRTCPHGRPTMVHLSVDLLERQFGRRGSR